MSKSIEALKSELASAEMSLRNVRHELDTAKVSEVPADVKPVSPKDWFFVLLLLGCGMFLTIAGSTLADMLLRVTTGVIGILLVIVSLSYYGSKIEVTELMLQYNELSKQVDILKSELNKD